jgi:hypothetical protein
MVIKSLISNSFKFLTTKLKNKNNIYNNSNIKFINRVLWNDNLKKLYYI